MLVDKGSIRKILVLRYRSIGDIILSGPALEALRLTFPDARKKELLLLYLNRLIDIVFNQ
jgi:hypothetical protein